MAELLAPIPDEFRRLAGNQFDYDLSLGLATTSSLAAALRDARGAMLRDVDTGEPLAESASWLGALGYLIVLDQIGQCFALAGEEAPKGQPIVRALKCFAPAATNRDGRWALQAARNCIGHAYTLFSDGWRAGTRPEIGTLWHDLDAERQQNWDAQLTHRFRFSEEVPLVRVPKIDRRKILRDDVRRFDEAEETVVNLVGVANLVEQIATQTLPTVLQNGQLAFAADMTPTHFLYMYRWVVLQPEHVD